LKRLLLLLVSLAPVITYGADPETEIGQRFLEEERQRLELEALRREQESLPSVLDELLPVPEETPCFAIERIEVTGVTLLDDKTLADTVGRYAQKCLGKTGVNQLMQEITSLYMRAGYITSRTYIPPQDLRSGVLKLTVVEGYVEGVSINGNSASDRRKLWWAMPSKWEEHLRLPAIEQGMDQIGRVRSATTTMKIWPGEEPGASHVQIINETDNEFRGEIEYNNDGNDDTGRQQFRFGFEGDNIIGINDTTSLNLITSSNTNALTWAGSFPYRYWTFNLSHSYSEYLSMLPGNTDLFGQSNTSSLVSDYLIYRNGKMKLNTSLAFTVRRSERYLLGTELEPQKLSPVRWATNLSENRRWGFYSIELGYVHGTKLWGATDDPQSLPGGAPHAQFYKVDGRGTLSVPLPGRVNYLAVLAGQYADDGLYSSEQVHIGGRSSVRGTDSTLVSGDKGYTLQQTFSWPLAMLAQRVGKHFQWLRYINAQAHFDYGRAISIDGPAGSASSIGAGISARYQRFSTNLGWAHVLRAEEQYQSQNTAYLSLIVDVF